MNKLGSVVVAIEHRTCGQRLLNFCQRGFGVFDHFAAIGAAKHHDNAHHGFFFSPIARDRTVSNNRRSPHYA